VTEANRF